MVMTSPIEAVAARVLAEHAESRPAFIREATSADWKQGVRVCACGATFTGAHHAHVAAEVARAVAEDEGLLEVAAPDLDIAIRRDEMSHQFQVRQAAAVIDALTTDREAETDG